MSANQTTPRSPNILTTTVSEYFANCTLNSDQKLAVQRHGRMTIFNFVWAAISTGTHTYSDAKKLEKVERHPVNELGSALTLASAYLAF